MLYLEERFMINNRLSDYRPDNSLFSTNPSISHGVLSDIRVRINYRGGFMILINVITFDKLDIYFSSLAVQSYLALTYHTSVLIRHLY